ncbi:MAG TPA: dihydrofolate reductase, partial [Micromonosporaceae bacterium]
MTKTQYYTATSADGFIADESNSLDWLFEVERADPGRFTGFFAGVGAMCMGATTYEWVLAHDQLLDHPEKWQGYYGDTPCWVFTHRDLPAIPGANLSFVSGDVGPVHAQMVDAAKGANIWLVGGGELVGRFADQ